LRRTHQKHRTSQHESKLKSGEVELAVTGSAFKILQLMGKAQQLLYYTRVFARVKPEGKVRRFGALCGDVELHLFFNSPHSGLPRVCLCSNVRRTILKL
jgi:hypothetical protein